MASAAQAVTSDLARRSFLKLSCFRSRPSKKRSRSASHIAQLRRRRAPFDSVLGLFYYAKNGVNRLRFGISYNREAKRRTQPQMFSIPHLIIIFVVVLVVFGPEKLPELARNIGKIMGEFRRATGDLRDIFARSSASRACASRPRARALLSPRPLPRPRRTRLLSLRRNPRARQELFPATRHTVGRLLPQIQLQERTLGRLPVLRLKLREPRRRTWRTFSQTQVRLRKSRWPALPPPALRASRATSSQTQA
jgi:TatA/E family protein of Tat protein translocase